MFLRPPLVLLRSKRYGFFLLWFIPTFCGLKISVGAVGTDNMVL